MLRHPWPTGLVVVGLLLVLAGPAALGQVPTFEGEEVVVPGRRPQQLPATPAYVTVIPADELRRMGFLTLGEALRFLAEVSVRAAGAGLGGLSQLSIRGSSPQQVLVLIDGIPLNSTAQFGVNLSTIALEDVERIEVLRGPYSAIYGNALGGVIQVITRTDARPQASAGTGSHGAAQASLRLGARWRGGVLSLGAQYLGSGGDRPNADASRWTANARLILQTGASRSLTFAAQHTAGRTALPGPTFFPTPSDRIGDQRSLAHLTWTEKGERGSSAEARLWWLGDRLLFTSPGFVSDDRGTAAGVSWQRVQRIDDRAVLTWGAEVESVTFRSSSTFSSFAAQATTAAGYVQYDVLLRPRTLLGVGVRYDSHPGHGGQVNPRVGFVHFASETLRLRGGLGRAFRAPTFFELAFPGCSNPGLRPEEAWAADVGAEAALRPGLTARLNAFYTSARDLIVGGCLPMNVGSARIAGLSAELVGTLGGAWLLSANVTWSSGLDRQTGTPLLRLPGWQANLILRHAPRPDLNVSLLLNYVSARDDLDTSTFPATRVTLPGYMILGLRYEQKIGEGVIRAGVDNLLDVPYETLRGFPGAGRTFFVTLGGNF
ncbi:MAG TPA: TonB-dependent receptor [Candidatus Methylomirabilis sp.]|nr:TonB-dependent receptor [Candidatus Methylomirabilis sp.]